MPGIAELTKQLNKKSLYKTRKVMKTIDVNAQKQRFETFMMDVDLVKVGKRYFFFLQHDNNDGRYNAYCYILRVLSLMANVGGCYHHPDRLNETWGCYNAILQNAAVNAYIESLESK